MKIRRVMIAAPKSGSGKTLITCAFLQALKDRGENVISYKCGPDYIDGMFHEKVIGIPSGNLDTFFTDEEQTRRLLAKGASKDGIVVIEGVMGIFDGLSGVRKEGSSYHLAEVTATPIVFVVDVKGMGKSVIPLLAGFLAYDKAKLIQGVILNRISKSYYEILKQLIEEELHLKVFGFLPHQAGLHMESRHLGLILPEELAHIREELKGVSGNFRKSVSVEAIMGVAEMAEDLKVQTDDEIARKRDGQFRQHGVIAEKAACPVIAVARDEAFCFYYTENLKLLEEFGAKLVYFSPIYDRKLPSNCHGLLLGGGYPELYARQLSENETMRLSIRQARTQGMPMVAECGGFLYLHSALLDKEGGMHEMTGVLPGSCFYTGKLVRFGYIELEEKKSYFLPEGEKIKGHEFHYYDSTDNGTDILARKPVTGKTYSCMIEGENHWFGFAHLYYPSNPEFAKSFVEKSYQYRVRTESNTPQQATGHDLVCSFRPKGRGICTHRALTLAAFAKYPRIPTGHLARLLGSLLAGINIGALMEHSHRFFENRACKYFPCHPGLKEFNCLFCFCPMYLRAHCPGNPQYIERNGTKIKDCTNCTFPHWPENYDCMIRLLKENS